MEGRKNGTDAGIPPLALTLEGEVVGCSVGEERGFFLAPQGDVDVETAAVLEADGGCIAIAETLQEKCLVGLAREPSDVVIVLYLVVENELSHGLCDGGVAREQYGVGIGEEPSTT